MKNLQRITFDNGSRRYTFIKEELDPVVMVHLSLEDGTEIKGTFSRYGLIVPENLQQLQSMRASLKSEERSRARVIYDALAEAESLFDKAGGPSRAFIGSIWIALQ